MSGVQEATETLRAALRKIGVERHVQDAFDNLASCLVLLKSSSSSVQMIRKLCAVFRQSFVLLYAACLQPALQLSYNVLSTALGKLCNAHNAEDESLRGAWDATAEVVLSGLLDILDQKDGVNIAESHEGVWETLCHIICEFFFLDFNRGLPEFSISLCLSAYNTLTETAARRVTIRNALRQRDVLGGERLGAAISATRDYLLLEALLILFARLLPPTLNTAQGKFRRIKFVKEVLGSPKLFKCSEELLDIMQKTSDIHWDNVSAQIIDVLARSDITYPQPFAIDEIHVCGRVFPQPLTTDRLIMDRQAFLVNIVAENDDPCESLQVPYSHIRTITLDNSEKIVSKGTVLIMVYLTSPPLVADVNMQFPDASQLYAKFLLQDDAVGRFMEALRRRGVGKLSFLNPMTRMERRRKSVSIGSGFKFTNDSSLIPPTASFEGKVQHVNQVYKTDFEESTTFQAIPLSGVGSFLTPDRKPPLKIEVLEVLQPSVDGDVPIALKDPRLISPIDEASKPIQHSTRVKLLLGDDDELSEISEFEIDSNFTEERSAIKVSAPPDRGLKLTKHWMDCKHVDSSSIAKGTRKSPDPGCTGVARRSPETGEMQSISDSPVFAASSITQVDVSPRLLSDAETLFTAVGTATIFCPPVVSQNFTAADPPEKQKVNECRASDTGSTTNPAGKLHVGLSLAGDQLGQCARLLTPTSTDTREIRHPVVNTKDTSVSPKIAGGCRKREPDKALNKLIVEIDDESPHPRKKIRRDMSEIEARKNKVKSNLTSLDVIPISRVKRYPRVAKRTSPEVDQRMVDFDEPVGLKPASKGARRSSRIKKKQAVATGGIRPNCVRGKTRRESQAVRAVSQSISVAERKKSATTSPQDTGVEIDYRTQPVLDSQPVPSVIGISPLSKTNSQAPSREPSNVENSDPETTLARRLQQGNDTITCAPSQLSITPGEPRGAPRLGLVQGIASDAMRPNWGQVSINHEEIKDYQQIMSDPRTVDELSRVREVVEHSVTSKESEDLVEPTMESTPRREFVTIDLTNDDSSTRDNSEPPKAPSDAVRSAGDIQMVLKTPDTPDLPVSIATDEPAFVPSPRNRRRSVTFASPIECVLEKKLQSNAQISSSSCQPQSPSESRTLSPFSIPPRTVNLRRESTPRIALQNLQALAYDQTADEIGIQDIVTVLDGIQAVIIKGISDKFRNVKKNVQRSRDELVQQVLDELRGIVLENAQYFNELLRLEEDYYKNCRAMVCCWEELIDCNDGIAVHFQNTLKEHDRNISAKTFPRSLVSMQPVFTRRHANA